ncbi:MAG: hypothetical protein RL407_2007 [Bacteroidota bacterium]|jgi:glycosyltransferase involved in cell wall biosynthesis
MKKRVLIVTYYWPPSGGSGVQRWLKFAKYLPQSGWEPVIFTPENPDFDLQDESLLKEISPHLEVIRFPIWEPYHLFSKVKRREKSHPGRMLEQPKKGLLEKIAIWLRANILVPDPRIFWVKPAVKFLHTLLQEGQFQAVISTGPPHSLHLIGLQLKKKYGVPWLADFRDPWSQWEFLDTLPMHSIIRRRHEALERKVLQEANVVVSISPTFQRDLEKLAGRKVELLTNGFDPEDLPDRFTPVLKEADTLHLVYSGIIDAIRNPMPLLEAMKAEFESKGEEVKFSFVGKVSTAVQDFVASDPWLRSKVHFVGYVTHSQVFSYYAQAHALVLILTDTKNAKGNIPGKLFEYMATGIPILALGDPEGDSAAILRESKAGEVLAHQHKIGIQAQLRSLFASAGTAQSQKAMEHFARPSLTKQLSKLLDKIAQVS